METQKQRRKRWYLLVGSLLGAVLLSVLLFEPVRAQIAADTAFSQHRLDTQTAKVVTQHEDTDWDGEQRRDWQVLTLQLQDGRQIETPKIYGSLPDIYEGSAVEVGFVRNELVAINGRYIRQDMSVLQTALVTIGLPFCVVAFLIQALSLGWTKRVLPWQNSYYMAIAVLGTPGVLFVQFFPFVWLCVLPLLVTLAVGGVYAYRLSVTRQ